MANKNYTIDEVVRSLIKKGCVFGPTTIKDFHNSAFILSSNDIYIGKANHLGNGSFGRLGFLQLRGYRILGLRDYGLKFKNSDSDKSTLPMIKKKEEPKYTTNQIKAMEEVEGIIEYVKINKRVFEKTRQERDELKVAKKNYRPSKEGKDSIIHNIVSSETPKWGGFKLTV